MYFGPIQCPNCELPIEDDAHYCPHCHSSAPASAPWNQGAWMNALVLGAVLMALLGVDAIAGTHIVPTLWNILRANADD